MKKMFTKGILLTSIIFACCVSISVRAQVFNSKTTLHSSSSYNDYYTESIYSGIDSYNGAIYFVKIDQNRKPMVGKIVNGNTTLEFLAKDLPNYQARASDGHHEFSIGIDKEGYIHITGDMHNQPQASNSHLPSSIKNADILYWKSDAPGDISSFSFMGFNTAEKIPGKAWSYGHFERDRNGVLYYSSRTLARSQYYQKWDKNGGVGRGLGLYVYDTETKKWTARGKLAPGMSDASYKVIVYDPSGHASPQQSYQQYKAGIYFDKNNRMHLALGMNINQQKQLNCIIYAYSDDGGITFHRANGSSIELPMTGDDGPRQADVLVNNTDNSTDMDQAVVCAAWNNYPVVHYQRGSGKHKYWNGTSWSSEKSSPTGSRDILTFNEHTNQLYFIDIHGGTIHARTSFTSGTSTYKASSKFQHYDINTFRSQNVMNVLSWQSSGGSGDFEIVQLVGEDVGPPSDCNNVAGGSASIDDCNVCSGGNTGIEPNSTCEEERMPFSGTPFIVPGLLQAEKYDIGGNGIAYNDLSSGNTGGDFRNDDVDIETTTDANGGHNVGWIQAGEWLEYTVDVAQAGYYMFEFRVATDVGSEGYSVSMNGSEVVSETAVPETGGWQDYITLKTTNVALSAGEQVLRFSAKGSSFNLNWIKVSTQSTDVADCNGVIGGSASVDACGVCSGGNTGITASSPTTWYADTDGDGLGDPSNSTESCDQPTGFVAIAGDQCPNDGNKTSPGDCGCGEPEDCNVTGDDCDAPVWSISTAYSTPGTEVVYAHKLYANKWYTQGNTPGDDTGPWELRGFCGAVPLNCDDVSSWNSATQYAATGTIVRYNGNQYSNRWWTQGNAPGSSDVWKLEGPCEDASANVAMSAFPNPSTTSTVTVTFNAAIYGANYQLLGAMGALYDSGSVENGALEITLHIQDLMNGTYYLKISGDNVNDVITIAVNN